MRLSSHLTVALCLFLCTPTLLSASETSPSPSPSADDAQIGARARQLVDGMEKDVAKRRSEIQKLQLEISQIQEQLTRADSRQIPGIAVTMSGVVLVLLGRFLPAAKYKTGSIVTGVIAIGGGLYMLYLQRPDMNRFSEQLASALLKLKNESDELDKTTVRLEFLKKYVLKLEQN